MFVIRTKYNNALLQNDINYCTIDDNIVFKSVRASYLNTQYPIYVKRILYFYQWILVSNPCILFGRQC